MIFMVIAVTLSPMALLMNMSTRTVIPTLFYFHLDAQLLTQSLVSFASQQICNEMLSQMIKVWMKK